MDQLDTTRNHGRAWRCDETVFDSLELPGWEHRSIWGYDATLESYVAQLTSNAAPADSVEVEVWLDGIDPHFPHADCLVPRIVRATERRPLAVARAMGTLDPTATLRSREEITVTALTKVQGLTGGLDEYLYGMCLALTWLSGGSRCAPMSGVPSASEVPSVEEVLAERQFTTGSLYNAGGDYAGQCLGIEAALLWAVSPEQRDL